VSKGLRVWGKGTNIVSAEDSNDLAAAIELNEEPLVEVLQENVVSNRDTPPPGGRTDAHVPS